MSSRITSEKIGWGFAYFHPNNLTGKILASYAKRLRSIGIMVK